MNQTTIHAFCEFLKSIGAYLLGHVDIGTRPSSGGQLKIFISWPFQSFHKFHIVGNFAKVCYVDDEWATPKILGFGEKFRWSPSGATWGHFGRFPFFHGASNMCTKFFSNPSGQVMYNHHHVLRRKKNPHPNWAAYVKDISSYIWATHGTASQKKQCQPIKKSYMLGVWGFNMLILTQMALYTSYWCVGWC